MIVILLFLFSSFLPCYYGQNVPCYFYQEMVIGQNYYVYNAEYSNNYCRWEAKSPPNTNIAITCSVEIGWSYNCNLQRLVLSEYGWLGYNSNANFCGRTSFTRTTLGNQLYIELLSQIYSNGGGKFSCTLTALRKTPPQPPKPPIEDCACGLRGTAKIYNGNQTGINEFPAMAAIISRQTGSTECGASIISNWYAVTAAHCFLVLEVGEVALLIGDHDLSTGTETNYSDLKRISDIIKHPNFQEKYLLNDIALVKTQEAMSFNLGVSAICLPFRFTNYDFYGQTVLALGWGQLAINLQDSKTLQKVDLNIISNKACNESLDEPITYNQTCTYKYNKDSCIGDSGGPLYWQDPYNNKLYLMGLISFGLGCGSRVPAVNTRVTSYLNWIIENTGEVYCIS